jgi:hypothetical protein
MTIPAAEKTWQFNINQKFFPSSTTQTGWGYNSVSSDTQAALYAIKAALTGFTNSPWTVVSSCGNLGTWASPNWQAGASDYWTSPSRIMWNQAGGSSTPTISRSWIVLQQTGMGATFQLLFDCLHNANNNDNGTMLTVAWSAAGFTGGSTTTRPTAADEVIRITGWTNNPASYWLRDSSYSSSPFPMTLHVMMSTDGQCTRIFGCRGSDGQPDFGWVFERLKNPSAGWTAPYVVMINPGDWSNSRGYMGWLSGTVGNTRFTAKYGAVNMNLYATTEGLVSNLFYVYSATLQKRNQLSNEWQLFPVGVACETAGALGHHGYFYDMWYVYWQLGYLHTFPDDSSRKWWACDNLLLPWDGLNSSPGSPVLSV